MMFTCIVDNSGYFVDIYLTNELPSDIEDGYHLVDGALPNDIFMDSQNLPKWDGEKWVEGATQEEIDELTKPQPQEPTIEERLEQTEELLQTVTMAFTEYVFMQDMSNDS